MKALICAACILCMASVALAGEIYGTITDTGKPVPAGVKIEITIGGKNFAGETDKFGTYHVVAVDGGKGTLIANYKDQKLEATVFSYDKATRYDWTVETVDGKMSLKRK
jgi:hypothetical protein